MAAEIIEIAIVVTKNGASQIGNNELPRLTAIQELPRYFTKTSFESLIAEDRVAEYHVPRLAIRRAAADRAGCQIVDQQHR